MAHAPAPSESVHADEEKSDNDPEPVLSYEFKHVVFSLLVFDHKYKTHFSDELTAFRRASSRASCSAGLSESMTLMIISISGSSSCW